MKKKILIIEDEIDLIKVLKDTFEKENFQVFCAENGEEGVEKFYKKNPDLILLDINMPKKNGWEVCKEVREQSNIPIVMMTARDSEIDELKGLNIGADDYITKPFSLKVLVVKVKKILKIDEKSSYKIDGVYFDFKSGELKIDDEDIELTRREIQFLEYVIKNKGIIFSREQLLNEVWGFDFEGDDRVVDTLVKRVRKKLGAYSDMIKTVRGMGYIFDEIKN
ncbi:response regulator transcription factor [uncultured Fusobacterium sp.]|uniref:response regulator transcription factor n=1 Tax=uncultured Fusobacterium sp. TaxID=159267 RepID=UPI0025E63058|nr:response regulator transcription factor [uncultured Fusobacterium sp.]